MAKQNQKRQVKRGLLPLLLTIGGFFLFAIILSFVWIDNRPDTVARGGRSPEERIATLREQRERESEALNNHGWVDREEGVVRLRIERAMELVLEEINAGEEGASN